MMVFKTSLKALWLIKYGFAALIAVWFVLIVLQVFGTKDKVVAPEVGEYERDVLDLFGEYFSDHNLLHTEENRTFHILHEEVCCFTNVAGESLADSLSVSWSCAFNKRSPINNTKNVIFQSSFFKTLDTFSDLLRSLNVRAAVIEPSILYCMLRSSYQELLVKRGFNITIFLGSRNTVTYAIYQEDISKLKQKENIHKLSDAGFQSLFFDVPAADWMVKLNTKSKVENFTSHIFYMHQNFNFHVVVFYNRSNYLWHGALDLKQKLKYFPNNNILFVSNGAYEKFAFVSLKKILHISGKIYTPSNPHHFLFQMLTSRFLECNGIDVEDRSNHPKAHPKMSVKRFNKRTLIMIHQLKKILNPLMMNFWIWSGTMLGWYRQCDIIPYTTDVDFAAWASEVDDLDSILHSLQHSEYIAIRVRFGKLEEALEFQLECFKLRGDIFFLYRIHNGTWYSGHNDGYYFRYFYPNFTLCSAELLGEKVQVPCETEDLIIAEYGPAWKKPVSSWNYETSIRNRGPNIYWRKQELKNSIHQYYE